MILVGASALILAGCETAGSLQQKQLVKDELAKKSAEEHQQRLRDIRESANVGEATPEETADAEAKAGVYYAGLIESVRLLDDNTSPANVIARAAVGDNIETLRIWKTAQLARFIRHSDLAAQKATEVLKAIPSDAHINEATSIVLRVRKSTTAPTVD